MKTGIPAKGPIVLSAEVRRQDKYASRPNAGVVDGLLACPEKGFFVPIESESTASL